MSIGLVLSGGGMRGAAHIGVIKALEERGISPSHISGSSAGAIVGALYAYGYMWEEILDIFNSFQVIDITKFALGKPGFIDAEKFYPKLHSYIKDDDFGALKKKLTITATNILDGNLETYTSGQLIKPILASAAFPGVCSPVEINGSYYIDGGVLNNFPVEYVKQECDVVIGVYVNHYQNMKMSSLKNTYNVVERAFKLKTVKEDLKKFKKCDLIISPKELDNFGTFDRKQVNKIFDIGFAEAERCFDQNLDLINKLKEKS
jgi:NTE family protein